jgi:hypothetical protein
LLEAADSTWVIQFANSGEDALMKLKAARNGFDVVFVDETLSVTGDVLMGHELVQVFLA